MAIKATNRYQKFAVKPIHIYYPLEEDDKNDEDKNNAGEGNFTQEDDSNKDNSTFKGVDTDLVDLLLE